MDQYKINLPGTINSLFSNNFNFAITKLPEVNFWVQKVILPSITLGSAQQNTPGLANIPIPGDKLTFDKLDIQFQVDETMENYLAIYNWMIGLGAPISDYQYTSFIGQNIETQKLLYSDLAKNYSDAIFQVMDSANNPIRTFQFVDIFPVTLSPLNFSSTNQDVPAVTAGATFIYSYFKII